uniref:Uncharacterized protein n=1 Tax=Timema poppense TaxID=170557 RepID=A0A7R9D329_TIMPO|nr:unnamed protein product [Timema poppensis]
MGVSGVGVSSAHCVDDLLAPFRGKMKVLKKLKKRMGIRMRKLPRKDLRTPDWDSNTGYWYLNPLNAACRYLNPLNAACRYLNPLECCPSVSEPPECCLSVSEPGPGGHPCGLTSYACQSSVIISSHVVPPEELASEHNRIALPMYPCLRPSWQRLSLDEWSTCATDLCCGIAVLSGGKEYWKYRFSYG